jgi:protein-export membrane protein SecD/preprotein translocase SecF subunit
MSRRLRWRVVITLCVTLGISVFAWYPPLADVYGLQGPAFILEKRLRLGLDLEGGVHMVLRVNTDDALREDTRNTADRLREALTARQVRSGSTEVIAAGQFRVRNVAPDDAATFRQAAGEAASTFERATGPDGTYTFTMNPRARVELRENTVRHARQVIERRVDELGVAEPLIAIQGAAGDEVLVQLPGIRDVGRAIEILGTTALLEWRLVDGLPAPSREALLERAGGVTPPDTEVVRSSEGAEADGSAAYYLVRSTPALTGRDLRSARPVLDEYNRPAVGFSLTRDGAERFAALTSANVGNHLAIVLDGRVQSAPQIEGPITGGEGYIRGSFTQQEAFDLSLVLSAGALPASITYLGGGFVGPSLGSASVHASMLASLAGLVLIAAFLLLYYNRTGINAVVSVIVNLLLLMGMLAYAGGVLTLPGVAGLILTIGMGVDSNVLIFERIKEELAAGRSARAAVAAGFDRVFRTILDTHVASLIAAAFLFQFGTGPIRGFATTLTFGLLSNVFTAVFVSRTLFDLALSRRRTGVLPIDTFGFRVGVPRLNFHRWQRLAVACSAAAIVAGVALIGVRGIPLGLDFSGGTMVAVKFDAPVPEQVVHDAIPGDEIVQRYGDAAGHELLIRRPPVEGAGAGLALAERVDGIVAALRDADVPRFDVTGSDTVGPAMGADLQRKGLYATVASLAGITGYIALRFRPAFAVGAIAATCHDVVLTLSLLNAFGYELSLNVVAALLTITGYSVNDTIVIFDRVRENIRTMPRQPLDGIVNLAVGQTFGRTVITAGTTFAAVLALFLFGADALEGFAFTMLTGIVVGTYSTIFIAVTIAVLLSRRRVSRSAGV